MSEKIESTDATGPKDTTAAKLARWLSIAAREAAGTEGYKLYPGDWAALAALLREVKP